MNGTTFYSNGFPRVEENRDSRLEGVLFNTSQRHYCIVWYVWSKRTILYIAGYKLNVYPSRHAMLRVLQPGKPMARSS